MITINTMKRLKIKNVRARNKIRQYLYSPSSTKKLDVIYLHETPDLIIAIVLDTELDQILIFKLYMMRSEWGMTVNGFTFNQLVNAKRNNLIVP